MVNEYTCKGSKSAIIKINFASLHNGSQLLTLLHSERPKLYTILVFLSATGFKENKIHTHKINKACQHTCPSHRKKKLCHKIVKSGTNVHANADPDVTFTTIAPCIVVVLCPW